eukprot:871151_1
METPKTKKQVQRFLGLVNYLHRFIPNLHTLIQPLVAVTHKDVKFKWTDQMQSHFELLKAAIAKRLFVRHPDWNKPFFVVTDASINGIGGMLAQRDETDGQLYP